MERRKKALICLFLLVSLILPRTKIVKAEALPNEVLEGTATVADIVMTYYAESGCAVSNTDWINTLYNDLGSNFGTVEDFVNQGYLVYNETAQAWESTGAFATAIENTSAYASLGLNDVFNVSAQEAAELGGGVAAATGGTILGSATAGVASIGTVPLLGAVTAAYWAGIGIGTLINHLIDKYVRNIETATPITRDDLLAMIPAGGRLYMMYDSSGNMVAYLICPASRVGCYTTQPNGYSYAYLVAKPNTSSSVSYKIVESTGTINFSTSSTIALVSRRSSVYPNINTGGLFYMPWNTNDDNTFGGIVDGSVTVPTNYSPDLVGPNGNLEAEEDDDGGYTVPDMLPQVDTSTEAGKPLRLQDWLNFANQANTNTGAGQPDLNKDLFDDILDRIKTLIPVVPDPGPSPDPGGQTRPVPTPTPVPDPDYDVPQPEQPEWQSETTQQTEEVPDSIPTGKPWVVEGLQNKFPFCIPWDIKNMLGKFSSTSRQAPYISWRFNPPFTPIDYTFQVDLADFEDAAAILRTLELIAFIVGLAFATRYLIGAT